MHTQAHTCIHARTHTLTHTHKCTLTHDDARDVLTQRALQETLLRGNIFITRTHTHTHTHTHAIIHTHTHTHTHTHKPTHTGRHTGRAETKGLARDVVSRDFVPHTHTHTHTYAYTYPRIYTYTRTHTHTQLHTYTHRRYTGRAETKGLARDVVSREFVCLVGSMWSCAHCMCERRWPSVYVG